MISKNIGAALLLGSCLLDPGQLLAAEEWDIEWAPVYLWAVGAFGDQTSTELGPVTVDITFGDVVDTLDLGGTTHLEARKADWGFLFDFGYLGLTDEIPFPLPTGDLLTADLDLVNSFTELAAMRRLGESIELVFGARYTLLETDVSLPGILRIDVEEDWIDPFAGVYYRWNVGGKWSVHLRGDAGGFGVGADFTWHGYALAGYRLTGRTHLLFGYRIIDYDYEDDDVTYDANERGPILGVAVRFGAGG